MSTVKQRRAPASRKSKSKPTSIYLVVQQGGSSRELYLHTFDSRKDANDYRAECDEVAYDTSEPLKIPPGLERYLDEIGDILDAGLELL